MINIRDFGAVGDGITLDTAAVQKALDCCKKNGGTVVVPGGKTYKIGTIQIYSNTELYLESGAVLKQSDRIEDLRSISIVDKSNNETDIPSYINCEYNGKPAHYFIYATGENIRITGYGAIDGNESIYYGTETRYHIEGAWYPRTPLLYIENVDHFTITGVTLQNSAFWTLHMVGCRDVLVDGIRILITPGMVELGDKEAEYNHKFGNYAADCCDYILLVGRRHTEPIREGVLEKGFPEEKCLVFDKLEEAVSYAYAIKGQGHKYILLENDLTDNY